MIQRSTDLAPAHRYCTPRVRSCTRRRLCLMQDGWGASCSSSRRPRSWIGVQDRLDAGSRKKLSWQTTLCLVNAVLDPVVKPQDDDSTIFLPAVIARLYRAIQEECKCQLLLFAGKLERWIPRSSRGMTTGGRGASLLVAPCLTRGPEIPLNSKRVVPQRTRAWILVPVAPKPWRRGSKHQDDESTYENLFQGHSCI